MNFFILVFLCLLVLTMFSGFSLLFFHQPTHLYFSLVLIHMGFGMADQLLLVLLAFQRFRRHLGWPPTILKIPLYLSILASNWLPLTGEMLLGWTTLMLILDWFLTSYQLKKMGVSPIDRKKWRSWFLDYAILLQCMMTGLFITLGCLPFLLTYHKIHGLTLPFLVSWFLIRQIHHLPHSQGKWVWLGLAAFVALTSSLFYLKNVWRGDETDLKYPQVHRTVERQQDVPKLRPLAARHLTESASCSGTGCHDTLVEQWRGSSHRFAVNNQFFRKVVQVYIEMEGTEYVRTCINCHDPVGAFSLDTEQKYASGEINNPEGISCKACHLITDYDAVRGNGLYTVREPESYPDDGAPEKTEARRQHDLALHLDIRRHLRNYRRKGLYRPGEYCVTCHLVTVPQEVSGGDSFHLHTLFEQWRKSPWADHQNCVDCHLPRFQMDENGYLFFDHRIMGINTDLLVSADIPESEKLSVMDFNQWSARYLAGDLRFGSYQILADPRLYLFRKNPNRRPNALTLYTPEEIRRYKTGVYFLAGGPIIDLAVDIPANTEADGALQIKTKTTNVRVGHNFPSGPIDVQEIWLEAVLQDATGNEVYHLGGLDPYRFVDPTAPILGSRGIIDAEGKPLLKHEFWRAAKTIDKRVLEPFGSTEDRLTLPLAGLPAGKYTLKVQWNFRRMNQRIVNWVWPKKNKTMPIVILDYSRYELTITDRPDGFRSVATTLLQRPPRLPFDNFPTRAAEFDEEAASRP
ncbi:MAG: hypothetical protein GX444_19175 [Myxococcales bacterium]|nr:hypothetical protein [Myxococcales bacterium]